MLNACRGWRARTTVVIDDYSSGRAFDFETSKGSVTVARGRDFGRVCCPDLQVNRAPRDCSHFRTSGYSKTRRIGEFNHENWRGLVS